MQLLILMRLISGLVVLTALNKVSCALTFENDWGNADSVVVEAHVASENDADQSLEEESNGRFRRQFVSVTGVGQFPGFPPGWPFGGQRPQAPEHVQAKPNPFSEPCKTVRGEEGRCTLMSKCYPVLYSADSGNETGHLVLRNPNLAEILRSQVSGPCDAPEEIANQFLFKADAEFRRKLICCPKEDSKQQPKPVAQPRPPPKTTTTSTTTTTAVPWTRYTTTVPSTRYTTTVPSTRYTTTVPSTRYTTTVPSTRYTTTVRYFPQQLRPFGHRPPTISPGQLKTTTARPLVGSSCGISKIVGGTEAVAGKYPWIVALMNGHKQFCGGSLIDSQHVLTAAHCVSHMQAHDVARVRVLLGAHNIHQLSQTTVVKKVARLVRHRYFSHQTLHNDVAVMKLDSPVTFSNYIAPICLTRGQNRFANEEAVVAGWGSISEHGGQPSTLREVKIDIWTNDKCRQKYGHQAPGGITEHMMCAGSYSRDACRGDSGGPLMSHKSGNYFEQIGIVSWGIGCGRFPGVYSRVTDFLAWITKNIQ